MRGPGLLLEEADASEQGQVKEELRGMCLIDWMLVGVVLWGRLALACGRFSL